MKILSFVLLLIMTANVFPQMPDLQARKQKYLQNIKTNSNKEIRRKTFITSLEKGPRISASKMSLVFLSAYKAVPESVLNLKTPQAAERMGAPLNSTDRDFIPEKIGKLSLRKKSVAIPVGKKGAKSSGTISSPDELAVVYDETDGRFGVVSGKMLITVLPPATPESIAATYNLVIVNRPLPNRPNKAFFKAPADETLAALVQRLKNDPAIGEKGIEVEVQKRLRKPQ